MDVREKLVELLENASYEYGDIYDLWDMRQVIDEIADFLIARGVTVQDNTEISDELLKQLRNAPLTVLHEEPTIEVVQELDGCDFCQKFDFAGVRAEANKYGAHISLAICNTKIPNDEQFKFCPMCGRRLPKPPKGE